MADCRDTAGQERFRTITTAYYRGAMVGGQFFCEFYYLVPTVKLLCFIHETDLFCDENCMLVVSVGHHACVRYYKRKVV